MTYEERFWDGAQELVSVRRSDGALVIDSRFRRFCAEAGVNGYRLLHIIDDSTLCSDDERIVWSEVRADAARCGLLPARPERSA